PDAHRDDREAQEFAEQPEPEVGQHHRCDDEQHQRGEPEPGPGLPTSQDPSRHPVEHSGSHARLLVRTVNSPCGRTCRKITMNANTITLASDAVVLYSMNELRNPSPSAAITVPLIWPKPPTTTTRNASIR